MQVMAGALGVLTRSNVAAGFNPLSLSPFQWLSASYGMEKTAGVPAVNGDLVLNCLDKSGNSATANQPTSANRATYLATGAGGKPALQFSGAQFYRGTYGSSLPNDTVSVVLVANLTSAVSATVYGLTSISSATDSYNQLEVDLRESVNTFIVFQGGASHSVQQTGVDFSTLAVWSVIINTTGISLYQNGVLLKQQDIHFPASSPYFIMGARAANSQQMTGLLSELFIVNSELSSTNHIKLVNYFKTFYSIS